MTAATEKTTPSSCREILIAFGTPGYEPSLTAEQVSQCAHIGHIMTNHPLIGMWLQHAILIRYQRATGVDVLSTDTAIDWHAVITWLVENLPTVLNLLLQLLALFGI